MSYVQKFPKDSRKYQYVYIHLGLVGSFLRRFLPLQKSILQVIDEDTGLAIYNSEKFTGILESKGAAEYRKILNMMIQGGWEEDGSVNNSVSDVYPYFPRYRRLR